MKVPRLNKGFTLIELLVVIAIIGILAGILLPVLSRARESARSTQCASNVKQIGMGLIMYANENSEAFPTDSTYAGLSPAMHTLNLLYPNYISDQRVFKCPSDTSVTPTTQSGISNGATGAAGPAFDKNECSYGYDYSHTQADDADVAILADRPRNAATVRTPTAAINSPNHGGTVGNLATGDSAGRGQNVLYLDGHVEFMSTALGGWFSADGTTRDDIYNDDSTAGTDTYIMQDGS